MLQCPTPGCETLTRSSADSAEAAPGTKKRFKGVCVDCYKELAGTGTAPVGETRKVLETYLAGRNARLARTNHRQLTGARA
ncbi:hypothetical protein [Arthrobacter sp. UYCu723]